MTLGSSANNRFRGKKTVTLLGAGGFIGSHLAEHLGHQGDYRVIGVDVTDEKLRDLEPGLIQYHEADLRYERKLLEDLISASDLVVDLVAYANPSLYVSSPLEVFELNFLLNLDVARLCADNGVRLIQYSSAEVYGKSLGQRRFSEDETDFVIGPVQKHRWIYSSAKALLERVIHAYGLEGQLEYTIIRPFNFIGRRLDYLVPAGTKGGPRVFPHFMSALLTGGPMYLVDGGTVRRSFLHIEDANAGFQTLLDQFDRSRNEIFNIGNEGNNITIRDLAVLMKELYGELTGTQPKCELVEISGEEFYGEGYEDGDRPPPDTRKLRSLGWRPTKDLRATLSDAMEYYLENPELIDGTSEPLGSDRLRPARTATS